MLSLKNIDLDMLTTAMENASYEMQWWLDPDTGGLELTGDMVDEGLLPEQLEERGYVAVEMADSHRGYRDMEDFIATLEDEKARAALFHAIERKRPFRHFKGRAVRLPPGPGRLVRLPRKAHAPPRRHLAPVQGNYRRAGSPQGVRRGLLSSLRTEA